MSKNTNNVINCQIYTMKKVPRININGTFGQRLALLRKAKGMTQKDLAEKIGISQRMLSYYEKQSQHIPAGVLPTIAKALKITVDELLGLKATKEEKIKPQHSRVWRKLMMVEKLPPYDRKAVLHYINTLLKKHS